MDRTSPKQTLPSTFDALAAPTLRHRAGPLWLPFIAIASLVVLIAALFAAIVLEDRRLQREALHRDLDSAAQRFAARLGAINEAASAAALELAAGSLGERRFASVAQELMAAKPEIERIALLDVTGAPRWPPVGTVSAPPPGLAEVVDAALRARGPVQVVRGEEGAARLLIAFAVRGERPAAGALLLQVDLQSLLVNGVGDDMRQQYRLALLDGSRTLAATDPAPVWRWAARETRALAALPGHRLAASLLRPPEDALGGTLVWGVGVLAGAVVIALGVLARYTVRLVRADRALVAETSLRRAMEDSMATGLRVLDRDGVIRYVNRAFCQMTGFPERELLGRAPPFPYWPPEHREDHERKLRQLRSGEAPPAGFEVVVQRRDGSRFDARMYVSPLIGDDGTHIGWMTSMADVTEPKRIRNELAAAHDRFTKVLESLEAAVSVVAADGAHGVDAGGDLLFANRAYQQLLGDGAAGHDRLASLLRAAHGEAAAGEVQDEQTARWYDVRTREIRWVDGRAARLQIASDITLRKATEEIFRQQQEKVQFTSRLMTMGEMASSLAHELNQPLTAINNYSQGLLARLQHGPLAAEELVPTLQKLSTQAQRAGRIIRRIREFVKRSEPRRRPTPAGRIVDDAIGFAEIEARKKGISIVARVADLPPLDVDPILIEQVLLNLLKNAIDAMDQATVRRIDVEVRRGGENMAEITVTDRGSGIAPEHRDSVFQPFFSTKSEGMGMGMNICRSIIEFHQGRLSIEDNPEAAGGTIMRFSLPLAVAPAVHTSAAAADDPARPDPQPIPTVSAP